MGHYGLWITRVTGGGLSGALLLDQTQPGIAVRRYRAQDHYDKTALAIWPPGIAGTYELGRKDKLWRNCALRALPPACGCESYLGLATEALQSRACGSELLIDSVAAVVPLVASCHSRARAALAQQLSGTASG